MPTARKHRKPAVPREAKEAEKVARQMYDSLTCDKAPKATPSGYIMAACHVLGMLMTQAAAQGADKEKLKLYALQYINGL